LIEIETTCSSPQNVEYMNDTYYIHLFDLFLIDVGWDDPEGR